MKFLLFNITVGCALFYLVSGGDLSHIRMPENLSADNIKQELSERFNREDLRRLVDKLNPEPASQEKPSVAEVTPEPQPEPVQTPRKTAPPPPPFPEAVEVAKHTAKPVPTPAAQPEPVIRATPEPRAQEQEVAQIETVSDANKAAKRNKMLRQLVRDMERMADSKLLY